MYAFLFDRRSLTLLALGVAFVGALLFFGGVMLGMGIQIDRTRSLAEPVPSTNTSTSTSTNTVSAVSRGGGAQDVSIPSPASWRPNQPAEDSASTRASGDGVPAPFYPDPEPESTSSTPLPPPPSAPPPSAPPPSAPPLSTPPPSTTPPPPTADPAPAAPSSLAPTSDDTPEITEIPPPSATGTPGTGPSASWGESGGDAVSFTVQVGAFSERTTAQNRLEELAAAGWTTLEVREVQARDGATLFAVQLGRFDDRLAAEDEATRFEKATQEKPVVKILDESAAPSEDPG